MKTEEKSLILDVITRIKTNLDSAFPTRETDELKGTRGLELSTINNEIARCERAIQYINTRFEVED